jgi:glucuronate isomerase
LRNPLYHWTHLELKRYFGIETLLDENSAQDIWDHANAKLPDLSAQAILRKFDVQAVCTTDDPADSLEHHERIAASGFSVKVFPAFRPDKALRVEDAQALNEWMGRLSAVANVEIGNLSGLLDALKKRHDDFHEHGCRLSDHGLDFCFADPCTRQEAEVIFSKVRKGTNASTEEATKFASFLKIFFAQLDAERGWTKQLHLGVLRNANSRMLKVLGRDMGFDSIGDGRQALPLAQYLDRLDRDGQLPKMIVYNSNPSDNYLFATMLGNFQDGSVAGKIQFGSAWWFLDQKEGIEWQLNALSNCGLLARFVGMITDSRSFMSFPRHEYFRRILCNLVGTEMQNGLLPDSMELVGKMVRNICFHNAASYLNMPGIVAMESLPVAAEHA